MRDILYDQIPTLGTDLTIKTPWVPGLPPTFPLCGLTLIGAFDKVKMAVLAKTSRIKRKLQLQANEEDQSNLPALLKRTENNSTKLWNIIQQCKC